MSYSQSPRPGFANRLEPILLISAVTAGLLGAVLYFLARQSFWEDEIIALTHGLQPLPSFFVEVLRNDIHPFFYFLVIKAWSALGWTLGWDSDRWILASSLISALVSTGVVAYVAREHFGLRAAWWAAALFVVLPNFAWAAGNLRMYALVPGLIVLTWHANMRFLETGRRPWLISLLLLELILIYTHVIEFFFVGMVALGALACRYQPATRKVVTQWFLVQTVAALGALPILAAAVVRGAEPLPTPDLFSLFKMPALLIAGWKMGGNTLALGAAGVLFFGMLALSLGNKTTRVMTPVIVLGTLVLSMIVALVGKPIFKPPVFTANLVPFLILGSVAGLAAARARWVTYAAMLVTAALVLTTISWSGRLLPRESYKPTAVYLLKNSQPGDVVVVPNVSVYWGILRYAVGSHWGIPLEIMPLQDKSAWAGLKQKLGPKMTEFLSLNPKQASIEHHGLRFVIGNQVTLPGGAANTWMVFRKNYKETVQTGTPVQTADIHWFNDELSVSRVIPADSGPTAVSSPKSSVAD